MKVISICFDSVSTENEYSDEGRHSQLIRKKFTVTRSYLLRPLQHPNGSTLPHVASAFIDIICGGFIFVMIQSEERIQVKHPTNDLQCKKW